MKRLFYRPTLLVALSLVFAFLWHYGYLANKKPQTASETDLIKPPHYSLRLGLNLSADSALYAAAQLFANQIAKRSAGQVHVTVYPDQQLGTDEKMLEMVKEGKVDLLLTPTAKLSTDVPAMQYADLPFYFADRKELYAMLDGEPGNLLLSKLNDIGLVGISFWENGFKQFTANKPIHRPEDFAGLRIRTMKSRLLMEQFEIMGAQPVVIDFATLRQALADKFVDGQENPLVAIAGKRIYEVQTHLILSNHAWLGYVFSASQKSFANLPQHVRTLIVETARELAPWEREETARREAVFLETIRAAGVNIETLTEQERQRFAEVLTPLVRGYGFEIGYDLFAKTDELRILAQLQTASEKQSASVKRPWLIGLDADLSGGGRLAGGAMWRGMDMAVAEINANGGLLGRPLQIIAKDHRLNPIQGVENIKTFAGLPNMLAVFGGMHSSILMDEIEPVHQLKIPVLLPWCAVTDVVYHQHQPNYMFRLSIDDGWTAPFLLKHALQRGHRVAVLLEQSSWGRSNEKALKPQLEKLPPGTVTIDWINRGETDFASRLQALEKQGIEVLLLVANTPESVALVNAMAKMKKPFPIYAHWGLTGGDFWRQTQQALQHVDLRFVQSFLFSENKMNSRLSAFAKRYRERYRLREVDPIPVPAGTVHAYELVHLLALAVKQANSGNHQAIQQALEHLQKTYSGVLGDYHKPFNAEHHDALAPTILRLARYDSAGHIVGIRE